MPFGYPTRRKEPLHVIPMAGALALAAALGAAAGSIWHAAGLGSSDDSGDPPAEEQAEAVAPPTP